MAERNPDLNAIVYRCSDAALSRAQAVPLTDNIEGWTDDAFWQELRLRLDEEGRERLVELGERRAGDEEKNCYHSSTGVRRDDLGI
jgi:hypothetical protein